MEEVVRGMMKLPNHEPMVHEFMNDLETFQRAVQGYIETIHFTKDILLVVNEEGWLEGLKPNFKLNGQTIVGRVAFVRDGGEVFASLTDWDIKMIESIFRGSDGTDQIVEVVG